MGCHYSSMYAVYQNRVKIRVDAVIMRSVFFKQSSRVVFLNKILGSATVVDSI